MEGRGYEKLVALYLRLNGYFIIENFIIHPQHKGPQRGEVDVFGVRFPDQAEKVGERTMPNDPKLVQPGHNCVDVVFADVKSRRRPGSNKTWRKEGVLEYVLRFVGFTTDDEELSRVTESLRKHRNAKSQDNKFSFRIVGFSERRSRTSNVPVIRLDDVLQWIVDERFKHWAQVKTQRDQWAMSLQDYLLSAVGAGRGVSLEDIKKWEQSIRTNAT